LSILSEKKVKFLLVGAYAMAVHGYPRSTMDIDLFVKPDTENALLMLKSLEDFGAPVGELSIKDFQKEDLIFQIGVAPCRIDIITSIDGVNFDEAYAHSEIIEIDGIPIHVLSIQDLIANKRTTGRTKDLADAEMLESLPQKPYVMSHQKNEPFGIF
jgi:predicted nucleotidyltransferase